MQHLPVFLKLEGKPCLVVGGGAVAERKVALLRRAGARVTVVAPELSAGLAALRDARKIRHHEAWQDALLGAQRLVIAATDDPHTNAEVARAAERRGVFCNVVDDGEGSGFILPAIVDRSPVVVAIGTGGHAPVLAQRLKTALEAWLPARIGVLAERAGRWRALVKKRFATLEERRRFWQRFFDGPAARHVLAGRDAAAEALVRRELVADRATPPASPAGEAWIVGAGPGDPGLVTLRAQQLIASADVVLYDRLVSRAVLDFARKEAELVPVGKAAGRKLADQDAINALLVRLVREGKRVCRLKGGDPFVFGRGGEEAQALSEAGLPYEIVPGVTAALGCAAYAGIPLTQRGMSGAVTFATAKLDGAEPEWAALVRPGHTLVLYMSAGSAGATAAALVRHGAAADTPAAIVENGTTSRQRVLLATLATLDERARAAGVRTPALMIVGPTAALAAELAWFAPEGPREADEFQHLPGEDAPRVAVPRHP